MRCDAAVVKTHSNAERTTVLLVHEGDTDGIVTALEREVGPVDAVVETRVRDAVDRLEQGDPAIDCVVSDHRPPDVDGLSFLRTVRNGLARPGLPFVLLADDASEDVVSEALSAGVTDCVLTGSQARNRLLANRIGTAVDRRRTPATRREAGRDQTLDALHSATRDLMRAESTAEIHDVAVRAADEVLACSFASFYAYDDQRGVLEPETYTRRSADICGEITPLARGEGLTWGAFKRGDPAYYPDVRAEDNVVNQDTRIRSELQIPLGNYGVLVVGSTAVDAFDASDVEVARILAASVGTALERVDRERVVREHERTLESQSDELDRLDSVNRTIRRINRATLDASTVDELEAVVCDRLADDDRYAFAWIGTYDDWEDEVTPSVWREVDAGYVDQVAADGSPERELAHRAATTGNVQVVADVLEAAAWSDRRQDALTHEFQSVAAVPLQTEERVYGVAVVHAKRPRAFGDLDRQVLAELGDHVGHAARTTERETALRTGQRVELVFDIGADSLLSNRLSEGADCEVDLQGFVPRPDGGVLCFLAVTGAPAGRVEDCLGEWNVVDAVRRLEDDSPEEPLRYEVRLATSPVFDVLRDTDGRLVSLTATDGTTTAVAEFPRYVDVRAVASRFETACSSVEFRARRETDRYADDGHWTLVARVQNHLTERQYQALKTAHLAGFFEWPRRITGEALAETLDIEPPTFHYHMRTAQRKVIEMILNS